MMADDLRKRIADSLAARTRGLCIIRTDAIVTHEGWTGPAPMVIRPSSNVDPYGLAAASVLQCECASACCDHEGGRCDAAAERGHILCSKCSLTHYAEACMQGEGHG